MIFFSRAIVLRAIIVYHIEYKLQCTMVHNEDKYMAERIKQSEALTKIGILFEQKRKALGKQYKSRERFINNRSDELFGSEDWISLRHLCNIERGKNWISIEKLILLADALEEDPSDLFDEIVNIYRHSKTN
jgi:transcriptional regulator with XRE-family HTH domain